MLATTHLIASQYNPNWTRIASALTYLSPVAPRTIKSTIAPRYHHRMVSGWPVKLRLGRPGTCVQETSHLQYMTKTQGKGITNRMPMKKTSERQTNSQIPNSIDSEPLSEPATPGGILPGAAGGLETEDIRPGISPAFCQPAMPSVQTRVSARTVPLATNSRN